ncbi:class I SAM-dependent methyltransferase [Streptomyces sp. NBC_00344]|uniref:class I SAM-dependent methyltransferase n=1 Tax=Streptomyces sp. NBC_00344 TaxID=2975720 RepID=UPI002E2241D6
MIDYDREATHYDASRGGEPRAAAAAAAVERLLPEGVRTVVDVACGTGIVTWRLHRPGRTVLGVDRSQGMTAVAASRLPRGVVSGDATCLPVGSVKADAVVLIWLLHLLTDVAPVLAEAARVLSPAGTLVTTVDKEEAAFTTDSDIAHVTAPLRRQYARRAPDQLDVVVQLAAGHGLRPVGETRFAGTGQGQSPRRWREQISRGRVPWAGAADPEQVEGVCRELAALPDQDIDRPDPVYRLISLS